MGLGKRRSPIAGPGSVTSGSRAPGVSSASVVGKALYAAGEECALSLEPGKCETGLHGIIWWIGHSGYG